MRIDPAHYNFPNPTGFIVLEGVNGAGKTTLQQKIGTFVAERGIEVVTTREPGAPAVGNEIRTILLTPRGEKLAPTTELLLFAADRAEHVAKLIRPAIARGAAVISDRYYYSTIAFQGYGRGLNRATIDTLNTVAIAGTKPDLTILLDLDAATGLTRTRGRGAAGEPDALEHEAIDFHNRIRNGFLELADNLPEPFVVLDARRSPDEIFQAVVPALERWLYNWKGRA
ncbi:MAG: hypothetical protein RL417_879 [Pseudomonadota bacterium]|jgi:dTMP kinase